MSFSYSVILNLIAESKGYLRLKLEQLQNISFEQNIRINKYLPVALLYFFFNSFLLPSGLLYTAILTPLLLLWLYQYKAFKKIWLFFLFLIPFACIHFINGVEVRYYIISFALFFAVFIFALCFYQFLKVCVSLRSIFRKVLIINFILVIVACIAYFIPSLRNYFWLVTSVSSGLEKFPRLKLLTYEPSYYSILLVPVAMYYYLKMLFLKLPNTGLIFLMITLPLLLSFSLGVMLGIPLALSVLLVLNLKIFFVNKRVAQYIFLFVFLAIILLIMLAFFYPDNPLYTRIGNLFEGKDSSFRGRTFDSYELAWTVASKKSILFGVGLGQVKVLGLELWRTFYLYNFSINEIAIPCAAAETLAVFGIVGVCLRIGLQIFLFVRTKVATNYYRLALFIFIFIYQFTGSYIYNIAEYVLWILAFTPVFEEFNKKRALVTFPA